MKRKRIVRVICCLLLVSLVVWVWSRWNVWFGNPTESPYVSSPIPSRILLTFGDSIGENRNVSWQCDSVLLPSHLELQDLEGTVIQSVSAQGEIYESPGGKTAYYVARLRGLQSGHQYRYRVCTHEHYSDWYTFTIYPRRDTTEFLFVGDVQDTIAGVANQLLKQAFKQHPQSEFLVCGGDLIERPLDSYWDEMFKTLDSIAQVMPILTVTGNHDIRGTNAKEAYHQYMPGRMSQELGKTITKTTFGFNIGDDAYIFIDFNNPDDVEIDRLLDETKGARHTFIVTHGPVFPADNNSCRWIFHGGDSKAETEARRHFRQAFAKRNAIVLCGHIHTTEFMDWYGDGGRITQMTMSSVWTSEKQKTYTVRSEGADQYGMRREKRRQEGEDLKDERALFDEYRPGIRQYTNSSAQGCYKLNVSKKHVTIDFYAGDSEEVSHQFVIR